MRGFKTNVPDNHQKIYNRCILTIIGFGMSSTLLNFQDKYYEYGDDGLETKGLSTGGYESAFLADLVAS